MRHEAQAPRRRASAAGARHPVGGRLPPSSGAGGHRLFLPYRLLRPDSRPSPAAGLRRRRAGLPRPLVPPPAAGGPFPWPCWPPPGSWRCGGCGSRWPWGPRPCGWTWSTPFPPVWSWASPWSPPFPLPEALWTNCATLLVLLALVPLGALLGLGVVRLRSFWLVFVSSFPFVLLPLCISVTPGWLPLMALVLGWVVPALTSLLARTSPLGGRAPQPGRPSGRRPAAGRPQPGHAHGHLPAPRLGRPGPTAPHQSGRPPGGRPAGGSGPFGIGSGGGRLADADGSVSLSDAGPLRFSGRTVLEVETDLTGRIYLRGLSDAVYDGESWQPLDEAAYNWQARLRGVTYGAPVTLDMDLGVTGAESLFAQFQPMNFPALAVRDAHPESPYARITVRNVGADPGYVYVPYHILTQPGELSGAEFVHDAYLAGRPGCGPTPSTSSPTPPPAASAGLGGSCLWRRRPTRTSCGSTISRCPSTRKTRRSARRWTARWSRWPTGCGRPSTSPPPL